MLQSEKNEKTTLSERGILVKRVKLGEVVEVISGMLSSRANTEEFSKKKYNYKVLMMRNFLKEGVIDVENLELLETYECIDEKYITKKGDVIVRLTHPYTAISIGEKEEGIFITSHFCILRSKGFNILSEYLATYLNSREVKEIYESTQVGVTVKAIRKKALEQIEIPLFDREKQEKLAEVHKLMQEEITLVEKSLELKEKLYEAQLEELLGTCNN